jgi:hypothetical protein
MFGLFKNKKLATEDAQARFHEVEAHYEGEVDAADYWDPDSPEDFKGGAIIPNGTGKLTFKVNGEVRESYEGELSYGAYNGEGKLIRNGEVFEGEFEEGKFIGTLE